MENLTKDRLNYISLYVPAVIYSCLPTGNFPPTFITKSVKRIMGYEPSDFIEKPNFWSEHLHPDEKAIIFKNLEQLFIHDKHSHHYRFKIADGSYKWFQDDLQLIRNNLGEPIEIFGCMIDVHDQKLLLEENAQLKIKEKLMEQKEIFLRDMHDGFGSELAMAKISLLDQNLNQEQLEQLINNCILDLHLTCDILSEDIVSIDEALINFKYRMEKIFFGSRFHINFQFNMNGYKTNLSSSFVLNILRIIKEALVNAIQHSKASNIFIRLDVDSKKQELIFIIKDNGIGLSDSVTFGRGINNMKARAQKINGKISFLNHSGLEVKLLLKG